MSRLKSPPDYYEILGLTREASLHEITASFVRLLPPPDPRLKTEERVHPEQARQINLAYLTLGNPAKRRAYDEMLASAGDASSKAAAGEHKASAAFVAAGQADESEALVTSPDKPKQKRAATRSRRKTVVEGAGASATAISAPVPKHDIPDSVASGQTKRKRAAAQARRRPAAKGSSATAIPLGNSGPKHDIAEVLQSQGESEARPLPEPAAEPTSVSPQEMIYDEELVVDPDSGRRKKALLIGAGVLALVATVGALSTQKSKSPEVSTTPAAGTAPQRPTVATANAPASAQPAPPQQDPLQALLSGSFKDGGPIPPPPETTLPKTAEPAQASTKDVAAPTDSDPGAQPQVNEKTATPEAPTTTTQEPPVQVASANAPAQLPSAASLAASVPTPTPNRAAAARQISGGLLNSDNPYGRYRGTVKVRLSISTAGQVAGCQTVVSSGNPKLDAHTCDLVRQRLRFSPALNRDGQPTTSEADATYTWGKRSSALSSQVWNFFRGKRPKH